MSFYATVVGYIQYRSQTFLDAALDKLRMEAGSTRRTDGEPTVGLEDTATYPQWMPRTYSWLFRRICTEISLGFRPACSLEQLTASS